MATYYAITQRHGHWEFVCSGQHPDEVYHTAAELIQGRESYADDDGLAISPSAERRLDILRVVPAEVARETYHVTFARVPAGEPETY